MGFFELFISLLFYSYETRKWMICCTKKCIYMFKMHWLHFYGMQFLFYEIQASTYLMKSFLLLPYFRWNCFLVVVPPIFVLRLTNHICSPSCFHIVWFCGLLLGFFCEQNNVKLSKLNENVPSVVIMIFCYFLKKRN